MKVGLSSSYIYQKQLEKLKAKQEQQGTDKVSQAPPEQVQQAQQSNQTNCANKPEWIELMTELGLKPTGSKEGDFALIEAKIAELKQIAQTEEEMSEVAGLQQEFTNVMKSSENDKQSSPIEQTGEMAGLTQMSDINKYFLLKKKVITL